MTDDWLCPRQAGDRHCVPIARKSFTVKECRVCKRDLSFLPMNTPPKGAKKATGLFLPQIPQHPLLDVHAQSRPKTAHTVTPPRRPRKRLLGSISESPEESDESASSTPSSTNSSLPE